MKRLLHEFFVCLALISLTGGAARAEAIIGEGAPDFSLLDTQGREHALSDYRGQFVVLEWTSHQCPFVRKHYDSGNMQKIQEDYTGKGVSWFTIISSAPGKQGSLSAEEARQVADENESKAMAVLLDPEGTVGRLYEAKATPHMYVIDPDGVLLYQGAIDSIPSADPADIREAENYVKAALDAAMAGKEVDVTATKAYGCSVKY